LGVDLQLRMIGAHVTLAAGARQASNGHRGGVARVAGGAGADSAVGVGLADAVTLDAAAGDGRGAFAHGGRIRRTFAAAGVELLGKGDLLRGQALLAVDRGPRRRRVPAAQELLVLLLVAGAAVGRGDGFGDGEAVVLLLLLARGRLVTFETAY